MPRKPQANKSLESPAPTAQVLVLHLCFVSFYEPFFTMLPFLFPFIYFLFWAAHTHPHSTSFSVHRQAVLIQFKEKEALDQTTLQVNIQEKRN
jgi:hypothetical protein